MSNFSAPFAKSTLTELAEAVVSADETLFGNELDDPAKLLFLRALAMPGMIARGVNRGRTLKRVEIVARGGDRLRSQPLPGDVVIRVLEGGSGHASIVVSPGLLHRDELSLQGFRADTISAKGYVHVIERTPFAETADDNFARGLTDSVGRVLDDLILLRLATPAPPTVVTVAAPSAPPDSVEPETILPPAWEPVESGPGPLPVCPPFLPPVASLDYLRYIQPATIGLIRPLINGRSSGGTGPDVDRTEPLDAMETLVKSLGAGDFVYLSAWFFEPGTALTAGGYPGATNWGALFAKKAMEGVRIRLILNDFDPISGMDKWLQNSSIDPLNLIIAAMPKAFRDNYKYIVSMHPAHVGFLKSLFAGQGGRSIYIASHHQKFMVAKHGDEMMAFCGGLDIESRKTPAHWSYSGLIGWHDIHISLQGPVTRDLEREFVNRWNRERGSSTRSALAGWKPMETLVQTPMTAADFTPAKTVHHLQMLRTISVDATFSAYSNERDDIKRIYELGIKCATQWMYFENQYFRSTDLADWIVAQGRANPKLVVIMVVVAAAAADDGVNAVTQHGDYLQYETFRRIVAGLGSRVRLYTMKNRAVHSKFVMVDDRWMSIGSANANVRSFDLDSEMNFSIAEPTLVADFRLRLWSHNLGIDPSVIATWKVLDFLPRWDAVAAANQARALPDMDGEGIVPFDYRAAPGKKHGSIPDSLAQLDFAPDGGLFAGRIPSGDGTIRLA